MALLMNVSILDLISGTLLLWCSVISFVIYLNRRGAPKARASIWVLMSIGLLYLTADEVFDIHEHLDLFIHRWFSIDESAWSDRIDDLIILSYIVIAIIALWMCREEIRTCTPSWRIFLLPGLVIAIMHTVFDALSNRDDVIRFFCGGYAPMIKYAVGTAEQVCEIGAEGLFLLFFVSTLSRVSSSNRLVNEHISTTHS